MMIALCRPSRVYIASADKNKLSDPPKSISRPVWRPGLPEDEMPPLNSPVFGRISDHIWQGAHNVAEYGSEQDLRFLDRYLFAAGLTGFNSNGLL